ncbi:auxin-responsive protein SAUR67-like [Ipomoea triloba]|uniref:auxin-responsive protein SAUR67-like n=1 Tax=Ipomoea triloba TaxID=35885 RepID=UPI00125E5093|nr:auxin-responsive protein SAUR67-like [Ipomoea triloba]
MADFSILDAMKLSIGLKLLIQAKHSGVLCLHLGESCSASSAISKGHFAIYTADQKRLVVPLVFLDNEIIRQLLVMSEEEFGLPSDGPITFPCDAVLMEYIISLLSQGVGKELQTALLASVTSNRCSLTSMYQGLRDQQFLVC